MPSLVLNARKTESKEELLPTKELNAESAI